MQAEREKVADLCREDLDILPEITFPWKGDKCPICFRDLGVRATRRRTVISTTYRVFTGVDKEGHCRRHAECSTARSEDLRRIVPPGANYAYDVLVEVGFSRILECRQASEISLALSPVLGRRIPEPTVNYLARKFVAYFQIVHEESAGLLRKDMRDRGGYVLHVDGTCEGPSAVLLLCVDSLSDQILESRKISSENHDEVAETLDGLRRRWGVPLAIVHDLRIALFTATSQVFPGVPQFACHYHFAADVGKGILDPHQDGLRRIFRETKVRAELVALRRSLKPFAISEETGDHVVSSILNLRSRRELQEHCSVKAVKGTVHALASWILAYPRDGEGYGFPFDMPYLSFYERALKVHEALREAITSWPDGPEQTFDPLKKLKAILDTVVVGEAASEFDQIVEDARRDRRIFERLRAALRICPNGGKDRRNDEGGPQPLSALSAKRHKAILESLRTSLKKQASHGGPSRRACEIVVQHLDKYWPYLFGHVIRKGSKIIVVSRTNNIDEGIARIVKRQWRRLHGRGHVGRDLEAMPPGTPLVLNLNNAGYCDTVYGGKEHAKIAERFSRVDPKKVARLMRKWREEKISVRLPRKLEGLATLPTRLARFLSVAAKELGT